MNTQELELLIQEAERFTSALNSDNKPQICFIYRENINECKIAEPDESNTICFNNWFLQPLDLDFAMLIVLHEIFHFVKQGIRNYIQVAELRYGHLWPFMQFFDIEADLFVVEYLRKENVLQSFKQYLEILHVGALTFKNPSIRLVKLERFIGSLVTVKSFFNTGETRLFLPKLSLNTVTMLIIDFEEKHLVHGCFEVSTAHLEKWKIAFQNANEMTWTEYINFVDMLVDEFIEQYR